MIDDKDLKFVTRHYVPGHFITSRGWKRLGLGHISSWRSLRVAAAVAGLIFLTAGAVLIYNRIAVTDTNATEQDGSEYIAPAHIVKVIDFEDATLLQVVARIEEVYGVEITNIPENADNYRLSLHYEGTAADLVETINEILDTQISVKE